MIFSLTFISAFEDKVAMSRGSQADAKTYEDFVQKVH